MTLNGGTNSVNMSNSTPQYASLVAQTTPSNFSTDNLATVYCRGTLSAFTVTLSGSATGFSTNSGYSFSVMLNDNGTLTCTINEAGTGTGQTDTTHCTDSVAPTTQLMGMYNTVNVRSVPLLLPTPRSATWSATYTWSASPSSGGPIQ